jgi:hypothetical protein
VLGRRIRLVSEGGGAKRIGTPDRAGMSPAGLKCRKTANRLRAAQPSGCYPLMGTGARDHLTPAVRFKDWDLRLLLGGAGKSNYWRLRYLAGGIGCMCPVAER